MKRQIILLICIILIGGMAIILPYFFSSYLDRKEANKIKALEENHNAFIKDIGSSLETINEPELLEYQKESELYDESQIYYEGVEILYDYLKFSQVEDVKEKIQNYIHQNINKDVLDCKFMKNTIRQENNILSFNLEIINVKFFEVRITKDNEGTIIDFTILHNIK